MHRKSPHIRDLRGPLIDYNGVDRWSVESIQKRYEEYSLPVNPAFESLTPHLSFSGDRTRVWPLMDEIISRIDKDDRAAIEIGIEFLFEDDFFCFGRRLKSNNARALRRALLTMEQKDRIRSRLVAMLIGGQVGYEWKAYKRLLRTVDVGPLWPLLEKGINRNNKYVMRYYDYLKTFTTPKQARDNGVNSAHGDDPHHAGRSHSRLRQTASEGA